MSKNNVVDKNNRDTITDALTEMLKTGAQQLIQQAVEVVNATLNLPIFAAYLFRIIENEKLTGFN